MPSLSVSEPRASLSDLRVNEIAFCDTGTNPGAHILFFKRKAPEIEGGDLRTPFVKRVAISKIDEEQRIVYGWASIIEYHGEPVSDWEGDVISEVDLEKAAHYYAGDARGSTLMHDQHGIAKNVASLCFTRKVQQALGIDLDLVGWLVGFEVIDDAAWEDVKVGKLRMFSIGGVANRTPIAKSTGAPVAKLFTASSSIVAGHGHVVGLPIGGFGPGNYLTNPADVDQHVHTLKVPSAVRAGSSLELMTECGGVDAHQHAVVVTVPGVVVEQRRGIRREILAKLRALVGKAAPTEEQIVVAEEIAKQGGEFVPRSYAEVREDRIAYGVGDALDDRVYALSSAFYEILSSGETDKESLLIASLEEFATMTQRDIPRLLSGEIAKTFTGLSSPPADAVAVRKLLTEQLSKTESEKGSDPMEPTFDLSKLSTADRAMVEPVIRKLWETAATRGTELEAALAKTKPPEPTTAEAVVKALPAEVAKAVEPILKAFEARTAAAETKADTVTKAFDAFQKAQRKAEIRKAAGDLKFVEGSVDEIAATLEKADAGGVYDDVLKTLRTANATVEKSGAFSEIGGSGSGSAAGDSAHSQLTRLAKALVEKEPTITFEAAYDRVTLANPELGELVIEEERSVGPRQN